MFGKEKFVRFILFERSIKSEDWIRNLYVYNDEEGDVTTIYQSRYEPTINHQDMAKSIKVAYDFQQVDPFATVLIELSFMLRFRLLVEKTKDPVTTINLGRADAMLWPISNALNTNSLLPIFTMHSSIWIPNLATKGSPTYFLDQFHIKLWIAFIVMLTIISMLAHLIGHQLKRSSSRPPEILKLFSILLNQGGDEFIKCISHKILIISLSMLAIVISSAFGAFLSVHLAIRYPDLPFTNLVELLNRNDYTICALPKSTTLLKLEVELNSVMKSGAHLNTLECNSMFHSFRNVVNKTCPDGKIALVASIANNNHFELCNLKPISGKYFHHYFTTLVTPNYKYKEQLNVGLIRLATAGVANFLQKQIPVLGNHPRYKDILNIPEGSPVSIDQIIYILMMVIVFGILSAFMIAVECVVAARL